MKETKDFANWTEYNDWNIQNYSQFSVINLNEIEGGIVRAEYVPNEEWAVEAKRLADEKEAAAQAASNPAPEKLSNVVDEKLNIC